MDLPFRKQWNAHRQGRLGHRFQSRYHAHRLEDPGRRNLLRRLVHLLLAAVFAAIGVVLAFIPGPAILFFFLAGAMLASDWLWMARLLDWLEVKLQAGGKWAVAKWRRLPAAGRVLLVIAGGCLSAATTYGAYRLMQ